MLLNLCKTVGLIEESPTDEVVAASILTSKLLRTLHVGNLLKKFVGRVEI